MLSPIEDRLALLEDTVQRLEETAARDRASKKAGLWMRLGLLGGLAAFYAYYLTTVSGTLTGL